MSGLEKLITFIESPDTASEEREKAISELNLLGINEEEVINQTLFFWREYFRKHMLEILRERLVLISHLLPDEVFRKCFEEAFEEYKQRRKDLGLRDNQILGDILNPNIGL